MATTSS
jgi:hypothetical protein